MSYMEIKALPVGNFLKYFRIDDKPFMYPIPLKCTAHLDSQEWRLNGNMAGCGHFNFYKQHVVGLLFGKFTNVSNVKSIEMHCSGDTIFKMDNPEKDTEMPLPFKFFYIDGAMFSTVYFRFNLDLDLDLDLDLESGSGLIPTINLSAIPVYTDDHLLYSRLLQFPRYQEIPRENRTSVEGEYLVFTGGTLGKCNQNYLANKLSLKLEREHPFSVTYNTKKYYSHLTPTTDPGKLIIALYSWNLNDVIAKFPQDKIIKLAHFEMSTAPPAKDLVIVTEALHEFQQIAHANHSEIGNIRKYTYYTEEQERLNKQLSDNHLNEKWELYTQLASIS